MRRCSTWIFTFVVTLTVAGERLGYGAEAISKAVLESVRNGIVLLQCPGGTGSGFVVEDSKNYYVFTAHHVCPNLKPGQSASCTLKAKPQGFRTNCSLLASDADQDMAIYTISPPSSAQLFPMKLSSQPVVDGWEIAFTGYPYAIHTLYLIVTRRGMMDSKVSLTLVQENIVTKEKKESRRDLLIIDGTASPGDSGGPVFLPHTGEVIGMTVATTGILKDYALVWRQGNREVDISDKPTGILLAVPIERIMEFLKTSTKR